MGVTTITINTLPHKIDRCIYKDENTTTKKLGFRITGYIFKDENGEIIEKEFKPHGKAKEEMVPGIFENLLKSGGRGETNAEALAFYKRRCSEILDFFQNHNSRSITGSSLLIILDNAQNHYDMRIIDVCSMKEFDDLNERDEGYIKGISNILEILNKL